MNSYFYKIMILFSTFEIISDLISEDYYEKGFSADRQQFG